MPAPDDDAFNHVWPSLRAELRRAVAEATWDLYLADLRPRSFADGRLVVEAPAQRADWIAQRFGRLLHACAEVALGDGIGVEVVEPEGRHSDQDGDGPAPRAATAPAGLAVNPRLTFDQFVIGASNRLAHAAALAVSEMPGLAYNPLFICGAPGLGKSHLLHSIANYARLHSDTLEIRLTSAEAFTSAFLGALHGRGDLDDFKAAHRNVDMLLVDDVQFLQSKARTEEEFFHLFNDLHAAGAQIVLTSDRPPRDMGAMEDRLRERFEAGLVCEVGPPDLVTRSTVLRKRALQDQVELAEPDALGLIAERVTDNVRALEGALIRVVAFASLTGRPLTRALTAEVLHDLYPAALRTPVRSVRGIQERVCDHFGVTLEEMLSSSRASAVAWPRQVAMYLAREVTDESLPAIGAQFGGRTHTTILHAWRKAGERLEADPDLQAAVDRLSRELRGMA